MNKVTDMCRQVLCILVVAEMDAAIDSRKTRKVHIRNVTIQEKADIKPINTFLMKKWLSWFSHVQRRNDDNVAKSGLNTQIDGSGPRGRPKLRSMDRLKDDMKQNKTRLEWESDGEREREREREREIDREIDR